MEVRKEGNKTYMVPTNEKELIEYRNYLKKCRQDSIKSMILAAVLAITGGLMALVFALLFLR